jgi:hypothetical protein
LNFWVLTSSVYLRIFVLAGAGSVIAIFFGLIPWLYGHQVFNAHQQWWIQRADDIGLSAITTAAQSGWQRSTITMMFPWTQHQSWQVQTTIDHGWQHWLAWPPVTAHSTTQIMMQPHQPPLLVTITQRVFGHPSIVVSWPGALYQTDTKTLRFTQAQMIWRASASSTVLDTVNLRLQEGYWHDSVTGFTFKIAHPVITIQYQPQQTGRLQFTVERAAMRLTDQALPFQVHQLAGSMTGYWQDPLLLTGEINVDDGGDINGLSYDSAHLYINAVYHQFAFNHDLVYDLELIELIRSFILSWRQNQMSQWQQVLFNGLQAVMSSGTLEARLDPLLIHWPHYQHPVQIRADIQTRQPLQSLTQLPDKINARIRVVIPKPFLSTWLAQRYRQRVKRLSQDQSLPLVTPALQQDIDQAVQKSVQRMVQRGWWQPTINDTLSMDLSFVQGQLLLNGQRQLPLPQGD